MQKHQKKKAINYIPALDGLRGVAVLLVVLGHFYPNFERLSHTFVPYLANWLWVGVDLFFVLSGYLITRVLLAKSLDWLNFRQFVTQRFLRVAPAAYMALIIVFAIGLVNESWIGKDALTYFQTYWWAFVFFCENSVFSFSDEPIIIAHFWSLAPEFQFYLLWGATCVLLSQRYKAAFKQILIYLLIVLLLTQPFLRAVFIYYDLLHAEAIYRLTFTRLDGFCVGSLIAVLTTYRWSGLKVISYAMIIGSGLLWIVCLLYELSNSRYFVMYYNQLMQVLGFNLHAWFFGGVIGVLATGQRSRCLEFAGLRWVGKISYSLYIWHFILLVLLQKHIGDQLPSNEIGLIIRYFIMISISILAAYLSYRFIENPINRWRYSIKK